MSWIEGTRRTHLSSLKTEIAPHVTLVFPEDLALCNNCMMQAPGAAMSIELFDANFRFAAPVVGLVNYG